MQDKDETADIMWSTDPGAERLYHWSAEECADDAAAYGEPWPIQVYAWRRKVLTEKDICRIGDCIVDLTNEILGEQEWADPEEPYEINDAFKKALIDTVREHMPREKPWGCERAPELDRLVNPESGDARDE